MLRYSGDTYEAFSFDENGNRRSHYLGPLKRAKVWARVFRGHYRKFA